MKWDREIEKKIQEALDSGAFDNLPGMGEPLSLNENPYEDPSWSLAFHLLKSNEFTLPWVEKRREIETQITAARVSLRQAWKYHTNPAVNLAGLSGDWKHAIAVFRERIAAINHMIRSYNIEVPLDRLHIYPVDVDQEIAVAQESPDLD